MQVFAFVAPKIIGGLNAPSPVGELGMVEMTQALNLIDVSYEQAGAIFLSINSVLTQYFCYSPSSIFSLCIGLSLAISSPLCFDSGGPPVCALALAYFISLSPIFGIIFKIQF